MKHKTTTCCMMWCCAFQDVCAVTTQEREVCPGFQHFTWSSAHIYREFRRLWCVTERTIATGQNRFLHKLQSDVSLPWRNDRKEESLPLPNWLWIHKTKGHAKTICTNFWFLASNRTSLLARSYGIVKSRTCWWAAEWLYITRAENIIFSRSPTCPSLHHVCKHRSCMTARWWVVSTSCSRSLSSRIRDKTKRPLMQETSPVRLQNPCTLCTAQKPGRGLYPVAQFVAHDMKRTAFSWWHWDRRPFNVWISFPWDVTLVHVDALYLDSRYRILVTKGTCANYTCDLAWL